MKTTLPKVGEIERKWLLVDGAGKPVGRLAVEIANSLRGRNRPTFTPHIDTGDFVIVVNARQVTFSGRKEEQKIYESYTGYDGGRREITASRLRAKHPEQIIIKAVKGMLPKNNLGRAMLKRLKVYPDAEHPHQAQQPEPCEMLKTS